VETKSDQQKNISINQNNESFRFVMVDNQTCELDYNYEETFRQTLEGYWKENLTWLTNNTDSCWYGVNYINRQIELSFDPNGAYKWNETNLDSTLNLNEYGEYFLTNINDTTILALAPYPSGVTEFKIGDKMNARRFDIHWKNDSIMILIPIIVGEEIDYNTIQLHELKKRNANRVDGSARTN
jgi:hypothetical protein